MAFWFGNPYPTDQVLINRLDQDRNDFVKLINLFKEDSQVKKIYIKGAFESESASQNPRIEKYQKLMKKLDVLEIRRFNSEQIYFEVWVSQTSFVGGNYKGYVFNEDTSSELYVDSLDDLFNSLKINDEVYGLRKIDENWSLYLDVW